MTWLLASLDPESPDLAFGLCDLGLGCRKTGGVSLTEIAEVRGKLGFPVERDRCFVGPKPLSAYARDGSRAGTIIA